MNTKSLSQKTLTVFHKSIDAVNLSPKPLARDAQITNLKILNREYSEHRSQIRLGLKSLQINLCNAASAPVSCR